MIQSQSANRDEDENATLAACLDAMHRHRRLVGIEPEIVAHDLHPDLLSTRLAQTLGLAQVAVQHHHSHVVSVMGEHGLQEPVIGVAFDGFGLGTDGTGWGGEFFLADWMQARALLADCADSASIDIVVAQARAGLAAPWTSSSTGAV